MYVSYFVNIYSAFDMSVTGLWIYVAMGFILEHLPAGVLPRGILSAYFSAACQRPISIQAAISNHPEIGRVHRVRFSLRALTVISGYRKKNLANIFGTICEEEQGRGKEAKGNHDPKPWRIHGLAL